MRTSSKSDRQKTSTKELRILQDQLLLLYQFLNEITQVATKDELARLSERYKDALCTGSEEDIIYKLWQAAQILGMEIIFLKSSGIDASRNRKLSALTAEEKTELAEAERIIDENRFGYHFQPIVNATDGSIYSYEALMRPRSDIGLAPFHILKYAELTGRLNDIERVTFLNVLNIIDSDKAAFKGRKVFINSIPKTKLENNDFRCVGELLMKHSDTVVVELTEQAEPDEDELDALKERYLNMGVNIAIDDYGTGYSNVKNLLRYMPDYVKIDRSLLSDIQNSPKKRHFVREIIEFCHGNGIMALAEGVETSEELRTVILLGADLIQGFYTARPNAEIIDSIPYEIRQEIKTFQQERQDGRDQQVYAAEDGERIQLDKLVNDDYKCILAKNSGAENSEITIIGSPSLDTDIHIETDKDFKGRIILENVNLSNVKDRPCIDLGENSDVTLVLKGENKLHKGGIRVPEGTRFTLKGEGMLDIKTDANEYFGIGNDMSSKHGDIIFDQSGTLTVTGDGQTGICIGSGLGGNIRMDQGKYVLNMSGSTGVAIGTFFADTKLDIYNCDFNANLSLEKGVAIGTLSSSADIHIWRSSVKLHLGGGDLTAIGTIDGENAKLLIDNAIVMIDIMSYRCTCAGALEKSTYLKVENASFRAAVVGKGSLPFGGYSADTKVEMINADATVKLETDVDTEKYLSTDIVKIVSGRTIFTNYGNDIDLKISE